MASLIQRFFLRILPRRWGESMEAESRSWILQCPCGREISCWETGGIRWKAAGQTRRLLYCPECDKNTWHKTYRRKL